MSDTRILLDPDMTVLSNGLSVYALHRPDRPWHMVSVVVHAGAEHDPIGLEGMSYFVRQLMLRNASSSPYYLTGTDSDESMVETCYGYTYYQFSFLGGSDDLTVLMSALGDMFLRTKLERYVEGERKVILSKKTGLYESIGEDAAMSYKKYESYKDRIVPHEKKALYAGSGYFLERMHSIAGTVASLPQITQEDLQSFYDTYYTPANISIVGVGGASLQELVSALTTSAFAEKKAGDRVPVPEPIQDIAPSSQRLCILKSSEEERTTPPFGFCKGTAIIPGTVNYWVVEILEAMLNNAFCIGIQEQKLANDVLSIIYDHRYFYECSFWFECLEPVPAKTISDIVDECILTVADNESLFARVKMNFKHLLQRSGNQSEHTSDFAHDWMTCNVASAYLGSHQTIPTQQEACQCIDRVTIDDIRHAVQWLTPEKRWTCFLYY